VPSIKIPIQLSFDNFSHAVLIVVLIFFPTGFLGKPDIEKV